MTYEGTRTLARAAAIYLACLAFPLVYLLALGVGASWTTALLRGLLAALAVALVGRFLFFPLADLLLASLARAEKRRREDDG